MRPELEAAGLREWVAGGGQCFAVCAGAYLSSAWVSYHCAESGFRVECAGLGLLGADAVGPALPHSDAWARVSFVGSGKTLVVPYDRGPTWSAAHSSHVRTVAQFADGKRPAIVESAYGRGRIVCSSVHLEHLDAATRREAVRSVPGLQWILARDLG